MTRLTKDSAIAVLYGGMSEERSVSLDTGTRVYEALRNAGYSNVQLVDVDFSLDSALRQFRPVVVFNALHGTYGEDGKVQGLLEMMRIPYTGSPVAASAIGMNKIFTRTVAAHIGIPLADGAVVSVEPDIPAPLPFPLVLKEPVNGSSRGITMIDSEEQWQDAISRYAKGTVLLVERKITGREINVAVLHGDALDDVEIVPFEGFYDFDAKYNRDDTTYRVHTEMPESLRAELYRASELLHRFLGCRGVTRSDFIVSEDHFILLEINTLPGMTAHSLVPMIAERHGLSYIDLIESLLQEALNR